MTNPNNNARERRSASAELEVPGTPEQVWDAIATGPGITAWFVPTDVTEGEGGSVVMHLSQDMDATSRITTWDPPRRYVLDDEGDWQPSEATAAGRVATEFLVEARSGGTCVVRIVTSGFAGDDAWNDAIDSTAHGWASALRMLRQYLSRFPGRSCSPINVGTAAAPPLDAAWSRFVAGLGLPEHPAVGERVATSGDGAPAFAGVVEYASVDDVHREILLAVDAPADGLVTVVAGAPGDQVYLFVRAYLFGDDAPAVAAREEPAWRAWIERGLEPADV